MLKIYQK